MSRQLFEQVYREIATSEVALLDNAHIRRGLKWQGRSNLLRIGLIMTNASLVFATAQLVINLVQHQLTGAVIMAALLIFFLWSRRSYHKDIRRYRIQQQALQAEYQRRNLGLYDHPPLA